jgi:hypothetical protein
VYGTPQKPNWTFDDGRYFWNGSLDSVGNRTTFKGMIQLTPAAVLNMEARIKAFLANNPNLDPQETREFQALLDFVQNNDAWDLLSQSLDGFNNQLLLGMPGVFLDTSSTSTGTPKLNTTPPLPTLIGDAAGYPPGVGNIPTDEPYPPSGFLPWRAGQFEFFNLVLVDEWGQAIWPITSTNYPRVTIYMPADLTPVFTSPPAPFKVTTGPAVDSISPNVASSGSPQLTLTVNGAGFSPSAAVQWNGAALPTTFVSDTQLTAVVSAALLANPGSVSVAENAGGVTTNALPFVIARGPVIGLISANLMQAGMAPSASFPLEITGAGFAAGAVVQWNGADLPTEFVSPTNLIATVPAGLVFAPGTASVTVVSGGASSNSAEFTISPGAAISSLSPSVVMAGSPAIVLRVIGTGFEPLSVVRWDGAALATTFVSSGELHAAVPAQSLTNPGTFQITVTIGSKVLLNAPDSLVQLPPALLQPAQLDFALVSGTEDNIVFGPANPGADPICGWVIPNHLDGSLMAYDSAGASLGEMSAGFAVSGQQEVCWSRSPDSQYATLEEIAAKIPNFGPFLLSLKGQSPATFAAFLKAIDDTLWTTVPTGASFDQSLAVLIGRPLAMVRARIRFLLDGDPIPDPSWQFTFDPATPEIKSYEFAIELGNIAQLDDGLIGYFVGKDYGRFNVVTESGAARGSYLKPIGLRNNYIYMPFDGKTSTLISMLVDPRAGVHATTSILPTGSVSLPPQFIQSALGEMDVTFRVNGILTDQQIPDIGRATILMPVPKEKTGEWTWLEDDQGTWSSYATAPNDATARLSNVAPVLRRGLLKLSAALDRSEAREAESLNTTPFLLRIRRRTSRKAGGNQ